SPHAGTVLRLRATGERARPGSVLRRCPVRTARPARLHDRPERPLVPGPDDRRSGGTGHRRVPVRGTGHVPRRVVLRQYVGVRRHTTTPTTEREEVMTPETPPPCDPCTEGLLPVQSFRSEAIRVEPGAPLEPRLGRPTRPVTEAGWPPQPA